MSAHQPGGRADEDRALSTELDDDEQATEVRMWARDIEDPPAQPPDLAGEEDEVDGELGISTEVRWETRRGERDTGLAPAEPAEEDAIHITRRP